jgi:hypothetical protein
MSATTSLPQQLHETPVVERLREHSFNRELARLDHQDSVAAHHVVRAEFLDELAEELTGRPIADLLAELRMHGLLWSSVAEVVGVTDAAIRKWRRGEPIDPRHRIRLARLVALCRLFATYATTESPTAFAEWLSKPVIRQFSASPLQLLALNRDVDSSQLQPLLDWMLGHDDAERAQELLDRYLGDAWRTEAEAERRFRIVTNSAGERILLVDD